MYNSVSVSCFFSSVTKVYRVSSAGEGSEGKRSIWGGGGEIQRIKFAMCKGQSKTHVSLKSSYFN